MKNIITNIVTQKALIFWSDSKYVKNLITLEEYLTNRFYNVFWKNYDYLYNKSQPYFHWFIIDNLRKQYSKEYNLILNELKKR